MKIKIIYTECPKCHEQKIFKVDADKWTRLEKGEHIQNLFPELNDDDRERLITGICPKCWAEIFADDEEDSESSLS